MSACATAGISTIYMAIDAGGAQRRTLFFTDSNAIYCVVKFSSARQDATLDFQIHQKAVYDWSNGAKDAVNVHQNFANAEITPGTGNESVVAIELEAGGTTVATMCNGCAVPNLPVGQSCDAITGFAPANCAPGYINEGIDSAGPGMTCCASNFNNSSSSTCSTSSVVPYPAGEYTCDVELDGEFVGETPFTISYPTGDSTVVPPIAADCPVEAPFDGVPCYGWVQCGAKCAGFYPVMNSSTPQTCTCQPTGTWSCQ